MRTGIDVEVIRNDDSRMQRLFPVTRSHEKSCTEGLGPLCQEFGPGKLYLRGKENVVLTGDVSLPVTEKYTFKCYPAGEEAPTAMLMGQHDAAT